MLKRVIEYFTELQNVLGTNFDDKPLISRNWEENEFSLYYLSFISKRMHKMMDDINKLAIEQGVSLYNYYSNHVTL